MNTPELQLKYPVILIHGLGARATYGRFEYFHGVSQLLKEAGSSVYIASLTPWQTVEHRASQLRSQIELNFPDQKVNLVGHSLGGLDARYLTSCLGFEDRIASVTTIGTPNRGSTLGDLALGILPEGTVGGINRVLKSLECSIGAFEQVTCRYMSETFAMQVPMAPGVGYFSATTAIQDPAIINSLPLFWLPHGILKKYEGDNDGFVSVESSKWGEHICTYTGDHYAQIGQFLGKYRGMNHIEFYTEIFTRLKHEGF